MFLIWSNFDLTFENRILIYRLLRASAILLSLFFFIFIEKKYNKVAFLESFKFFILISFVAVLGAKFSSVLEFLSLNNFSFINFNFSRGFRISGIAFFVIIAISFLREVNLKSKIHLFSSAVLGLFVIGKWSCFFLGDTCYGLNTTSSIGFIFKGLEPSLGFVHPVTIYDSIFYFLLFLLLWMVIKKFSYTNKVLYIFLLVALLYSFSIEFLRINPKVVFHFSMNQVFYGLSIIYILIVILKNYYSKKL